jgi:hypothetical protein
MEDNGSLRTSARGDHLVTLGGEKHPQDREYIRRVSDHPFNGDA